MTTARKWLSWMRCRLACFALTRMHLRLQVKERHEPNLPRPRLLRRTLLWHLAEGGAEGGRAVAAKNAPRRRASRAMRSSRVTEGQRRSLSPAGYIGEPCTMGKIRSHLVYYVITYPELALTAFSIDRRWRFLRLSQHPWCKPFLRRERFLLRALHLCALK